MTQPGPDIVPWRDQLRQVKQSIKPAFDKTRWYVAGGLFVGLALLSLAFLSEELRSHYASLDWPITRLGELFVEHLGAGFFVSAIAVFAYEWAAHTREALELSKEAVRHSKELADLLAGRILPVADAVGREAIFRALRDLPGIYHEFYQHFATLTNAIVDLARSGDWSKRAYLEFIAYFVERVAHNANELQALSTALQQDARSTREFQLDLGVTGALAAKILTREILLLRHGGSYDALSDVASWEYLKEFNEAQEFAVVKNGVRIRRIFFLPAAGRKNAAAVVTSHYGSAATWTSMSEAGGSYSVRVITEDGFRRIVHGQSPEQHFGVFSSGDASSVPIAFQVKHFDLSSFSLRGIGRDDSLTREFEALWSELQRQEHRDVVDLLLENEVRHFDCFGKYYVVSDFVSWFDGGLRRFHKQCMKDVVDRNRRLEIRRVFVISEDSDDVEKCARVLDEHLGDLRSKTRSSGEYLVRICTAAAVRKRLGERWQCGLFIPPGAGTPDARLMLTEATKPDLSDFVVRPAEGDERAGKFDRLWGDLKSPDKGSKRTGRDWITRACSLAER